MLILLLIPAALASIAGLLFFTEALERRASDAMLRMAIRSPRTSPEAAETLFATELAHRLELAGLSRRPDRDVLVPVPVEDTEERSLVDLRTAIAPS